MRYLKYVALLGLLLFVAGNAHAQVRVGVYVGVPPVCNYGYYPYYPYACAPYGYYGPDWFVNGVFVGAGPWYHGYWGPRYYRGYWYGRGYYGHYGRGYYGRGWGHDRGWGHYDHGYRGYGGHRAGGGYHGGNGFHGGGGHRGGHR